jgi:hypothetical protein
MRYHRHLVRRGSYTFIAAAAGTLMPLACGAPAATCPLGTYPFRSVGSAAASASGQASAGPVPAGQGGGAYGSGLDYQCVQMKCPPGQIMRMHLTATSADVACEPACTAPTGSVATAPANSAP